MNSKPLNVSIRQLRYFVELAGAGSFRKAALRCGVSQPSLSAQIKALEDAVNAQLVERSAAGIALTPTGRHFVEAAVDILDRVDALGALVGRSPTEGILRLGVKATLGPYLMPGVVKRLHSNYPDLRLFITEGAPIDIENQLSTGAHDLILAQLPITSHEFVCVRLFREPLFLAVAADDPLAQQSHFSPSDLAGRDVLTLSPKFHLHEQVVQLCERHGANLLRDYEGTSLDALRQMVGMGLGVTLLPALYVDSEVRRANADVIALPQQKMTVFRSIGVAWRRSSVKTAAHDALISTVRAVAKRRPAIILEHMT
ncbi:MAG: LysR substrate-binding domain-containing protein [Pseudomonadota bacterium]